MNGEQAQHTEDELLDRSKHVEGEGHLILVDLQPHPAEEASHGPDNEVHHSCGVFREL